MKNVVLARIDDRLIHGQVMSKWSQKLGFTEILIVDDPLVEDEFTCKFMRSIAPRRMVVNIGTEEASARYLKGDDSGARLCVLAKTPQVFERLIENGVALNEVMLGGMGSKEGRTPLIRNVSASTEERESFKRLIAGGVRVFYQDIPETRATYFERDL